MMVETTIQARNIALNDIVEGIKITDRKFNQWCVIITGIDTNKKKVSKEYAKDEWITVLCNAHTTHHAIYPIGTAIAINQGLTASLAKYCE